MRYCPEPKTYGKKSYCRRFCLQNLKTDKKVLQPQKISSMYIEIFVSSLIWSPYYGCTVFLLWKGIVSNRWYLNRILTKQKSVQAKFVVKYNLMLQFWLPIINQKWYQAVRSNHSMCNALLFLHSSLSSCLLWILVSKNKRMASVRKKQDWKVSHSYAVE